MINKYLTLKKKSFFQSFLISFILLIWSLIFAVILVDFIDIHSTGFIPFKSRLEELIMIVFVGPVFETLFFQFLIMYQVYESYKGKNQKIVAIFISSLLFGLSHWYNIYYVMSATIMGLILSSGFCFFKEKTNNISAIFYIIIAHSLFNIFVFIIKGIGI